MAPTGESWRDYLRSEMSDDSLEALERALRPCDFAVHTEVAEDWAAPIGIRSRIEQRLEELRHDLGERADKLTRAYELTQAALHA